MRSLILTHGALGVGPIFSCVGEHSPCRLLSCIGLGGFFVPPTIPPENVPDWIAAGLSALGGILGRLMSLTQEKRMPFTRQLIWELPTAIAMGWIGRGLGEYIGLGGFPLFAFPIAVAYIGPRLISWLLEKYINLPKRNSD
jgi:hypothetical protein